ncbi:dna topoisomerase 2-alpha-like protein [Dermatophagoides farinae]|uniref:DNA topoisomerase 2 n=1 Tax=Dermatophagoides farinae TaxID=6954 RepID=A0A9D4NVI5_DERFA|nr:DNA topoisomerase 2-alpha-like [Dermatophagoides farinae]KAH7638897.1 dna topoisomerase 2-alpha-like protein [Dermatophagoides farinae]
MSNNQDFDNVLSDILRMANSHRLIPSLVDGFKPWQRKIIYTCFKRNYKDNVNVEKLAGLVVASTLYNHCIKYLIKSIFKLAQDFVGSNNISLLQSFDQIGFGSRFLGVEAVAADKPSYVNTMLSPLARKLFPPLDDPLLAYQYEDNQSIEPKYYVPIIPMVLVNGAVGSGCKTMIPSYDPRAIVENIKRMLRNEEPLDMNPWYKNFKGTVVKVEPMNYVINGEVAKLDEQTIEITELPIGTWTLPYEETVLKPMLHGTETSFPLINDYESYYTTTKFIIKMNENSLEKVIQDGIHKEFKLQTSMSISSMFLLDKNGVIRRYKSALDILREFFHVRLDFYVRRKKYHEGMLEAEILKLENQFRFILAIKAKKIIMENYEDGDKEFHKVLTELKFDSDPVKTWLKKFNIDQNEPDTTSNNENVDVKDDDKIPEMEEEKKYDFDYLIGMPIRAWIKERVEKLMKKRDAKKSELEELKRSTPQMLWEKDLDAFVEEYERMEKNEREKALTSFKLTDRAYPSEQAVRIEPKIDFEKYQPKKNG